MLRFKEYINENALTRSELSKYPFRLDVFKEKYLNGSPFEIDKPEKYNGLKYVTIIQNSIKIINTVDDIPNMLKVMELELPIPLGALKKSSEFGGKKVSDNKGNAYEDEFTKDLNNYFISDNHDLVKDLNAMKLIESMLGDSTVKEIRADGALNQKRPLVIDSNKIYVGNGDNNIGKIVSDITIITDKGEKYLSLKHGNTVTFVNAGVSTILSQKDMEDGKIDNKEGALLLNLLGIDNERFVSVFNDYKGDCNNKEKIDITKEISTKKFLDFMSSVIGYGYILVHKKGNNTHILDMTESNMKRFLKVHKASIVYPLNGCNKRVDIVIDMEGINIKINIRNKNGRVYPSNLMADYILH